MGIRSGETHVLIHVPKVTLRIALDLSRVSMEAQRGFSERNRLHLYPVDIGSLIEEDLIPIDVEIRPDANARGSGRQLSTQIRHHRSRETGGKTDIVADALPCSGCRLHFKKRNYRFDSRLMCGEARGRTEVLDESLHDHSQRAR